MMDKETFLENFGLIAAAPNGIEQLRGLILDLAICGKLVEQVDEDGTALDLLQEIHLQKNANPKLKLNSKTSEGNSFLEVYPDLPKNWEWTRLGEIGEINPRNSADDTLQAGFIPMARISERFSEAHTFDIRPWSEIKKGYTHVQNGDVVLAKITPCFENGKAALIQGLPNSIGAGTTEIHVVRPIVVKPEFVLLFLNSPFFVLNGIPRMTGTAGQKRLPLDYFSSFPFPLPPLAEQERIIEKANSLMNLCDEIQGEKVKREKLCTASRASAIDALSNVNTSEEISTTWQRLSSNWDVMTDSLNAIGDLQRLIYQFAFEGYFVSRNKSENCSTEHWRKALVGEILSLEYGKPLDKALRKESGTIPVYGANGIKCYTDLQYVDGPGIVVGRKGSAGEVNLTTGAYWPLDVTFYVVHDPNETDLIYLYHLLKHLDLTSLAHGIKPGINRNEIYKIPVFVPSVSEQQAIVSRIKVLMALCQELAESLRFRTEIEAAFSSASSQLLSV